MPGVKHQIPDPNDAVIKAVAHKIHQKRKVWNISTHMANNLFYKQIEKARNEEEAREMEKKRKEDEKRKKLDQQSKSLVAVKDELEQLHTKDCLNTTSSIIFYVWRWRKLKRIKVKHIERRKAQII